MANSTSNIDAIISSQASKEITANAFFDASSQSATYGRRQSTTSGLTWGFYGGNVLRHDGLNHQLANGTIALTASDTNSVEADPNTGAVSVNTSGFTAGRWPLYTIVTDASAVTSYTDLRNPARWGGAFPRFVLTSDTTLTIQVRGADGTVRSATITLA